MLELNFQSCAITTCLHIETGEKRRSQQRVCYEYFGWISLLSSVKGTMTTASDAPRRMSRGWKAEENADRFPGIIHSVLVLIKNWHVDMLLCWKKWHILDRWVIVVSRRMTVTHLKVIMYPCSSRLPCVCHRSEAFRLSEFRDMLMLTGCYFQFFSRRFKMK